MGDQDLIEVTIRDDCGIRGFVSLLREENLRGRLFFSRRGPVSGFALGSEWRTTRWTLTERTYRLWSSFATSLLRHRSSPACHTQGEGRKRCLRRMTWGYKGMCGAGKCPRAGPGSVVWCMCTCRKSIENYTPVLGPHRPHHGSDLHPSRR